MSSLMEKLKKSGKIKDAVLLKDRKFNEEQFNTGVFVLNLALSGNLHGGVSSGITGFAGESKHFKTGFSLCCVAAILREDPEAVCLFYDSEKGASLAFFESFDIDMDRVLHVEIKNVEELKFDIADRLESVGKEGRLVILIDSIGNLASRKEANDALDGNSAADLTRGKELKSFWRIVTPYVNFDGHFMFPVHHTYDTIEMYSKKRVSGGQGGMLAADSLFVVGKRQMKEGKEFLGSEFVLNTEKSRYIRERTSIPISVSYAHGINPFSGLLEIAIAAGVVHKPSQGWYSRSIVKDDKKWRAKETSTMEFWEPILTNDEQCKLIEDLYSLKSSKLLVTDEKTGELKVDTETGEILD